MSKTYHLCIKCLEEGQHHDGTTNNYLPDIKEDDTIQVVKNEECKNFKEGLNYKTEQRFYLHD